MSELADATLACLPVEHLKAAIAKADPERAVDLQPGYLAPRFTWCNRAVERIVLAYGAPIPVGMLANAQMAWLDGAEAANLGWTPCFEVDAILRARAGSLVLVGHVEEPNGHIAVVHPDSDASGVLIAQAGRRNFNRGKLEAGFGHRPVKFWRWSP